MTIGFEELCTIIAHAKSVETDFWKEDPLYIQVGSYSDRQSADTIPVSVCGGPDIVIDVNAEKEGIGIEFAPL